jgi:pimeloyl-ACP methyl ester carboxylesterase
MSATVQLPSNPLYRNIFLRTLSHASSLGADSGECFRALSDAKTLDPDNWASAWSKIGSRLDEHARSLLDSKRPRRLSAKLAYLRASNYHRTAFAPLFGHPLNKDVVISSYKAMSASFAEAAKLFDPPLIPLEIPYRNTLLRGYLACPPSSLANNQLIVVIGGYDAPMEEMYFFCSHHALCRGYSVLVFDGPGQGGTLLELGLKMSHTYDEALTSALDAVAKHGSWNHTIVMGLSLGGLLCLQAAIGPTVSSRVSAIVADPAELSLLDAFRSRLPFPRSICDQLPEGPAWAATLLDFILNRMAAGNSMPGWIFRRGMLVHGCNTPMEYVKSLHEFDNKRILESIKVPTLITRAELDEIGSQASDVYEALVNCEKKKLIVFADEDGAGEHCQTGARMLFSEKVFQWLGEVLSS